MLKNVKLLYSFLFGIKKSVKVEIKNRSHRIYLSRVIGKKGCVNNKIEISENAYLKGCTFEFYGSNNRIFIGKDTVLNCVDFYCEGDGNFIYIDEKTTMTGTKRGCVHLAALEGHSILIGSDCMFADDISVRTSDSHSIVNEKGERINYAKDVKIGNHVWIGTGVMLLKGAEILGGNSIVGARIVLTSRVCDANVLIAGLPGKVIKQNVNWDRKQLI